MLNRGIIFLANALRATAIGSGAVTVLAVTILACQSFGKDVDWAKARSDVMYLRGHALSVDALDLGLLPDSTHEVWGVIMESWWGDDFGSLICLAEGSVSLYFSNGSALIGFGGDSCVHHAADVFIARAGALVDSASLTATFPPPDKGECVFYLRTLDGTLRVSDREESLLDGSSWLSEQFYLAHDVIEQMRLLDERTEALLHHAAIGDTAGVNELVRRGVPVDSRNATGLTALMAACYRGEADVVRLLLTRNANVDQKDRNGYTALMYAANAGHATCAELLIAAGADVNEIDNENSTPLMFAAQHGYDDIVLLLLKHYADRDIVGKHGLSAMGFARQNGHKSTERILLSR